MIFCSLRAGTPRRIEFPTVWFLGFLVVYTVSTTKHFVAAISDSKYHAVKVPCEFRNWNCEGACDPIHALSQILGVNLGLVFSYKLMSGVIDLAREVFRATSQRRNC